MYRVTNPRSGEQAGRCSSTAIEQVAGMSYLFLILPRLCIDMLVMVLSQENLGSARTKIDSSISNLEDSKSEIS